MIEYDLFDALIIRDTNMWHFQSLKCVKNHPNAGASSSSDLWLKIYSKEETALWVMLWEAWLYLPILGKQALLSHENTLFYLLLPDNKVLSH